MTADESSSSPSPSVPLAPLAAPEVRTVAMIGNHLPRQCGIATFTTDLSDALSSARPEMDCFVVAMNDVGRRHAYPSRVRFEIPVADLTAYQRAADFVSISGAEVVSVQHEYGIFGGRAGSHLLALLRELSAPIVTTLHTILATPDPQQRLLMDELTRLSERLVVMSERGRQLLREVHDVPDRKIDVIPHGIPSVPFYSQDKRTLGLEGRTVILTFGLLSPDKGIEAVIDALPAILERHPSTVYVVLGATHPHVKEQHGETYRTMLEDRARALGVDGSVIMHNRFVTKSELSGFLAAADIYVTPYLNPEQITSGTLAYAVGAGKAVISTPYVYARELLADGRGILVPWRDPAAIAREVIGLLDDPTATLALRRRAAEFGRAMLWPEVARAYRESFGRARADHAQRHRLLFRARTLAERAPALPEVQLRHLHVLTDHTGILQHAQYSVPRYQEGYCLDDNARALLLTTLLEDAGTEDLESVRMLGARYLAFVAHAFDTRSGRFRNFLSYERAWAHGVGSEDGHGRALWALGTVVGRSRAPGRRSLADTLFHEALPVTETFTSPRAWAYALLGVDEYLRAFRGESRVQARGRQLAERLLDLYARTSTSEWRWFEDSATYGNARLSQALLASARWMGRERMTAAGLRSLDWLALAQRSPEGYFAPIGSHGFYVNGQPKAAFDQQPVEAHAMVSACLEAHRSTEDGRWMIEARRAFGWFLGQNQLHLPLYDPSTNGCRDGLHADRVNENQGAESTLSFLLALTEMRAAVQLEAPAPIARRGLEAMS